MPDVCWAFGTDPVAVLFTIASGTINSKHRENSAADTTLNQGWLRCGGAQEKPAGCSSACVVTEASSSDGSLCCYTSKVEI